MRYQNQGSDQGSPCCGRHSIESRRRGIESWFAGVVITIVVLAVVLAISWGQFLKPFEPKQIFKITDVTGACPGDITVTVGPKADSVSYKITAVTGTGTATVGRVSECTGVGVLWTCSPPAGTDKINITATRGAETVFQEYDC